MNLGTNLKHHSRGVTGREFYLRNNPFGFSGIKTVCSKGLLWISWLLVSISCFHPKEEPLKIATNSWIGYEPLFLARALGYMDDFQFSVSEMPSSSDIILAFRNKMIDCATLTLDESYLLLQDSIKIKILFIIDISAGADAILAKPYIKSLRDLKGKKVGVENSATGAYVLSRALESVNLDHSDIQLIPRIEAGHEKAYKNGEIDAIVTYEPTKSKLLNAGATVLFDSRQIPDEILDVFIVREDLIKTKPHELEKLKNIWYASLHYMKENPDKVYLLSSKRLGMTHEQFNTSFREIKFPSREESENILGESFMNSANRIEQLMLKNDLLTKEINPANLLIKR